MGQEVVVFSPPSSKEEETPIPTIMYNVSCPIMYKSDSEGEDNLIVSGPIIPMTIRIKIRIKITVASSGSNGILMTIGLWVY